jgi:hypothetical protein
MPSIHKCRTRRRPDHTMILGGAAIVLGLSILAGIAFTYGYERGVTAHDLLNAASTRSTGRNFRQIFSAAPLVLFADHGRVHS